jgi:uncharacterized protein YbaR (Trm112 family)
VPLDLSKTLLAVLRCPESKQQLMMADEVTLERLNQAIGRGQVKNVAGDPVTEAVSAALIRDDQQRLYLISDGFPVMLIDESIDLAQFND